MADLTLGRATLILGPSGRGKSRSILNLDPKVTGIMNWEQKRLPFKDQSKFKQWSPVTTEQGYKMLDNLLTTKMQVIVHDSFSGFMDIALEECRTLYDGWDTWSAYNKHISRFMKYIKKFTRNGVQVLVIAHDELVEDIDAVAAKRAKVKGNEWKGLIEKEFDMCLYARMIMGDDGSRKYVFQTNSDGKTPAKTPEDMFADFEIPNDMKFVLDAIKVYDK